VGAAALTVEAAVTAGRMPLVAAAPGALALLLLGVALWRGWPTFVAWALALLATGYALALALGPERATLDAAAPVVAAALLVVAELAYWSLELRDPGRWEGPLLARRLGMLGVLALVSLALGSVVVVFTTVEIEGGIGLTALGVGAAVATLAILAGLARRAAP
jgi:hypothetical protein